MNSEIRPPNITGEPPRSFMQRMGRVKATLDCFDNSRLKKTLSYTGTSEEFNTISEFEADAIKLAKFHITTLADLADKDSPNRGINNVIISIDRCTDGKYPDPPFTGEPKIINTIEVRKEDWGIEVSDNFGTPVSDRRRR